MESMCLRLQSSIMKASAGSVKVNQILLTSKKMAYTHLKNLLQGSWSLESRYRSSPGFAVRAGAGAGFPVLYGSSGTDSKGEKMVVKSGLKVSDTGINGKEFVVSQTGGPDIGDDDGHGGHGNEGNNGGGNSNNNNDDGYGDSGDNDKQLINTIWWLILLCIRMLRATSTMWGNGGPELVWLAMVEKAFEFVAVDLMMSTGLTSSLIAPSMLAVTELTVILFSGFASFMVELETSLRVLASMILAGFAVVTAGVSWAVFSLCSNWDIFPWLHDENDDGNDYSVE